MSFLTIANPIPILIVVIIALATASFTVRDRSLTDTHKFASIDGLRGFLALLVFIHHSDYWYHYSHQQGWIPSGTILYNNLGLASVCLFFMLSGFLFTYKLLEGRNSEINWLKLYCSRFLRLTPLYISLVLAMIAIILLESHFAIKEDWQTISSEISKWIFFTAEGHPNINQHPDTLLMTAGVIWTLPYEWYFYFCLPILGVLLGTKSKSNSGIWLIASCLCFVLIKMETQLLYGFAGGGIAAFVVWHPRLRKLFEGRLGNWIVLASLVFAYQYLDAYAAGAVYLRLAILTLCMTYIACGTNLFGLLSCRAARALSTISYGLYLLHGLLMYIVMSHFIPTATRINFTEQEHWLFVFACTPILIGLATITWYLIEKPAIQLTPKLTHFLTLLHKNNKN